MCADRRGGRRALRARWPGGGESSTQIIRQSGILKQTAPTFGVDRTRPKSNGCVPKSQKAHSRARRASRRRPGRSMNVEGSRGWTPRRSQSPRPGDTPRAGSPFHDRAGSSRAREPPNVFSQQQQQQPTGYTPRDPTPRERANAARRSGDWFGDGSAGSAADRSKRRGPPQHTPTGYTGNAVAPHTRPVREVTGKVTGNPYVISNHQAGSYDRAIAPYDRSHKVEGKVSDSVHPAHRPDHRVAHIDRDPKRRCLPRHPEQVLDLLPSARALDTGWVGAAQILGVGVKVLGADRCARVVAGEVDRPGPRRQRIGSLPDKRRRCHQLSACRVE